MNTAYNASDAGPAHSELGYVGLGKMGRNMVSRLLEKGYGVLAYDVNKNAVDEAVREGARAAGSLDMLAGALTSPRLIWIMVPHETVDGVLESLVPRLSRGDTVIDGGNSFYLDSIKRAESLAASGIEFLDVGVSGGPRGARTGACIMAGGRREAYGKCEQLFVDLSIENGCRYLGPHGAGHFVKMVHNGIEYGMMQAIGEGFTVMKESPFELNLTSVAEVFNHGSVITSRLVGWLRDAFERYGQDLDTISGSVAQSGEGLWTVDVARQRGIPAPVIEEAVNFRTRSRDNPSYTGRIISALRTEFGQHDVFEKKER
ncbi:MAG TPA: decarboxylating 6-phosphogluconate dehydrogenase [Syntrophorhabdaceae bacterium]|jgi:6-phosphogluconate dehydrogenase